MKKLLFGLLFVALLQLSVVAAAHDYSYPEGDPVTASEAVEIAKMEYPTRGSTADVRLELARYKGSTTRAWKVSIFSDTGGLVTYVNIRQETGQILRVTTNYI